jgi:hypothetical protein
MEIQVLAWVRHKNIGTGMRQAQKYRYWLRIGTKIKSLRT